MNERQATNPRPILAIVYDDGPAADRLIAEIGYRLRLSGVAVAGLVQHNEYVRDRSKCDMKLEELGSGAILQISEYRGEGSRGCRLDLGALYDATALLLASIERRPAILILNKFGKVEAEGGGLREVLAKAIDYEIPLMVGVPLRNLEPWRAFAGDLSLEIKQGEASIDPWLVAHGLCKVDVGGTSGLAHPSPSIP